MTAELGRTKLGEPASLDQQVIEMSAQKNPTARGRVESEVARPAGLEPATTWFGGRSKESIGGSWTPLPPMFSASVNRPRLTENASNRDRLSAVCQSRSSLRRPS